MKAENKVLNFQNWKQAEYLSMKFSVTVLNTSEVLFILVQPKKSGEKKISVRNRNQIAVKGWWIKIYVIDMQWQVDVRKRFYSD